MIFFFYYNNNPFIKLVKEKNPSENLKTAINFQILPSGED